MNKTPKQQKKKEEKEKSSKYKENQRGKNKCWGGNTFNIFMSN